MNDFNQDVSRNIPKRVRVLETRAEIEAAIEREVRTLESDVDFRAELDEINQALLQEENDGARQYLHIRRAALLRFMEGLDVPTPKQSLQQRINALEPELEERYPLFGHLPVRAPYKGDVPKMEGAKDGKTLPMAQLPPSRFSSEGEVDLAAK